jgi:pyruvate,water dikinase
MKIVELHDAADAALFGGKAHGLAQLMASKANVPAGFAVQATTDLPEAWAPDNRTEFEALSERLLSKGPIVVRSSAIGEDAADRSFAGLFDSVLGITNVSEAWDAAQRCVTSAGGERASVYAPGDSAVCHAAAMALVVQSQVDARISGVCFTRDPAGASNAIIIEAVAGLGDALVSGRAVPQRWRVYRSALGTYEIQSDDATPPLLDGDEVRRIAADAAELSERFGHPLDLEWSLDRANALWWLQARPITARATPRAVHVERAFREANDGPVTVWANWNLRETTPDPLHPLTWSIWRDIIVPHLISAMIGTPRDSPSFRQFLVFDLVQGRLYLNMNGLLAWPPARLFVNSHAFTALDAEAASVCRELMSAGVLTPRAIPPRRLELIRHALGAGITNLRFAVKALSPRHAMAELKRLDAFVRARRRDEPLTAQSEQSLYEEMRLIAHPALRAAFDSTQSALVSILVYRWAVSAFSDFPDAARVLATGLADNPTTRISLAIDELAAQARSVATQNRMTIDQLFAASNDSEPGRSWHASLDRFLDEFGHRGPKEFDIAAPRWSDDPAMILELVRAAAMNADGESLRGRMARLAADRRTRIDAAIGRAPLWRRPMLRMMARLVERHMPMREAPKHYVMLVFQRMRAAALELGDRFARRGLLDSAESIFFLELPEVLSLVGGEALPDLEATIADRRRALERFHDEPAPNFVRSDGVPVSGARRTRVDEPGVLRGTGISTGSATGPVRILHSPDPLQVRDGDIIVMQFADPGWTPLFPRAAAIVTEVGGLMCHAAVVARELGIPAVFGVPGATALLREAVSVTVDGNQGTVVVQGSSRERTMG